MLSVVFVPLWCCIFITFGFFTTSKYWILRNVTLSDTGNRLVTSGKTDDPRERPFGGWLCQNNRAHSCSLSCPKLPALVCWLGAILSSSLLPLLQPQEVSKVSLSLGFMSSEWSYCAFGSSFLIKVSSWRLRSLINYELLASHKNQWMDHMQKPMDR